MKTWPDIAHHQKSSPPVCITPLVPGMIYVVDLRSRRADYVDPALSAMFGLARMELTLPGVRRRLHPNDCSALRSFLRRLVDLPDDQVADAVLRFRRPGGAWTSIAVRARPLLRDRLGVVRRVMGSASEMSHAQDTELAQATTSRLLGEAEDNERRRIGRDLHDSTTQHLVAIDLTLDALERRDGRETRDPLIDEIRVSLTAAHSEIRTLAYLLHPPDLRERGLEPALRTFCNGFARRTGLQIHQDIALRRQLVPYDTEIAFFRIAQEALMNVHRHARATEAHVRLRLEHNSLHMRIQDDGVGMCSAKLARAMSGSGVGISGMRARLLPLAGALALESNRHGLTLKVEVPLDGRRPA